MKKLILFVALVMTLNVFSIMAVDQPIEVDVTPDIHMVITPGTLDFDSVAPDSVDNPALNGPIEFNPAGSNVDVTVEVTGVTGFPFETGLMLDASPALGAIWGYRL